MAEILLSQHQKKTAALWFELDHEYISAITYINKQTIILASRIASNIDVVEANQLSLLIPFTAVTLSQYRVKIIYGIDAVFENICLGYIEGTLFHLRKRQEELLKEANQTLKKTDFKPLSDLCSHITLSDSSLDVKTPIEEYRRRLNKKRGLGGFKTCWKILRSHLMSARVEYPNGEAVNASDLTRSNS